MRTNSLKRCLSFLLALALVLSISPLPVFAAEGDEHVHDEQTENVEEHVHESEAATEPATEEAVVETECITESTEAESAQAEVEQTEPETEPAETEPVEIEPVETEPVETEPTYSAAGQAVLSEIYRIAETYLGDIKAMTAGEIRSGVEAMDWESVLYADYEAKVLSQSDELAQLTQEEARRIETENPEIAVFMIALSDKAAKSPYSTSLLASGSFTVANGLITMAYSGNESADKGTKNSETQATFQAWASGLWRGSTVTITVTNSTANKATISFSYSISGDCSACSLGKTSGSGSYTSAILEPGGSFQMTLSGQGGFSGGDEPQLVLSNISIKEIIQSTVVINYDANQGAVTLNGTAVTSGAENAFDAGTEVTLNTTGANFIAWVDAEDTVLSTSAQFTFLPSGTMTIHPVYASGTTPYFMTAPMTSVTSVEPETEYRSSSAITSSYGTAPIGETAKTYYTVNKSAGKIFDNLQDAIADSTDSDRKAIVLMNNGTLPAGTYTIPAGSTLLIPFNDDCTLFTSEPWATRVRQWGNFYRTLTMASGAKLIINGAMSLSAAHHAANGGADGAGTPSGPLSRVIMEGDSSIEVNGQLYAWGYITGSGSVTAYSGAQVHENFQFSDFRGGTETSSMEAPVFPMSQYYVQNIEVPLTLHAGATQYSYTSIFMRTGFSYQYAYGSSVAFIGKGVGMFDLTDGYVVKRYDGSKDRLIVDVYGDISIAPINMSIATISINSTDYNLPINSNISVNIHSGTTTVKQKVALLPGAEIVVDKGAAVSMADGVSLYVYDAAQWGGYCAPQNKTFVSLVYAPGRTYTRTDADLVDAKITIGGTAYGDLGAIYTTEGGAAISGVEGGAVTVKPGSATSTSQYSGGAVSIPITPAKLQNGDGSYVTTAEYTEVTTFVYKSGRWHTLACNGVYTEAITTQPTCSAEGLKTLTCGCAHNAHSYTESIAKVDHTPGTPAEENRVEPTCTVDGGYDTVTRCTVCNEIITSAHTTVRATGHPADQREVIPGQAATCTVTGLTEGEKCKVCGEITVAQTVIPALGHKGGAAVKENETASTCTVAGGYDSVVKCSVCGTEVSRVYTAYPLAEHDFSVEVEDKAPTCTEVGYVWHMRCSVCDTPDAEDVEIPVLGHNYTSEVTKAPTCTDKGVRTFTCANDASHTYTEEIDALGHTAVTDAAVAPTCTVTGLTEGSHCSRCGETIVAQQIVAALGHTAAAATRENEKAATCEVAGSYEEVVKCSVCGAEISRETKPITALGHSWNSGSVTKDPTCEEAGVKTFVCLNDDSHTYTEPVAAIGHKWDAGQVTEDPTCLDKGVKTYTCTNNPAHTYTEEIAALDHIVVTDAAVAPTCSATGLTEGSHCSRCGETLVAQIVVDKLPHTVVTDAAVAATCHTTGLTEGSHCSVCNTVLVAQKVTDKLTHVAVDMPAVEATCTTTGLTLGSKCSLCGDILLAQTEIPVLSHVEATIPGKAATCTEDGLTDGKKCSRCGETLTAQEVIPALGHAEETISGTAATCTATGLTDGKKCSRCGTVTVAQKVIPMVAHTEEILPAVAPTCEGEGLTEGKECSVCGTTLVAQTVVPANGHTREEIPAVPATCTETGLATGYKCSVCDKILLAQTVTDALGHEEEEIPAVAATCTTPGATAGVKCSVCGEIQVAPKTVDALGHKEEIIPAVNATCTTPGLTEGKKCSVCGEILVAQVIVDAPGHTEEIIPAANATCTTTGLTEGKKCSRCGETLVAQTVVEKLPHTVVIDAAVAATCTTTGLTEGSHCANCDEVLVAQVVVPMIEHSWGEGVVTTQPDCTNAGVRTFTCSACGKTKTAEEAALGHLWADHTEVVKPATCTQEGQLAGAHCDRCGYNTELESIPALGHLYDEGTVTTDPTCTEAGVRTFTCTREDCDDLESSVKTESIAVLDHTEEEIPAVAATCTTPGATAGVKCSVCGEILEAPETINALGHVEVAVPGKAATCTTTGLTEGKKCSVCGEILVAQVIVDAPGHTEEIIPAVAATCTATGLTEGKKCSRCGETLVAQTVVEKLPHTVFIDAAVAATCTTTGLTEGSHCSVCKTVLVKQTVTKALGHTEVVDEEKAPTCTATGLEMGKHCSVCGAVIIAQKEIAALGHVEVAVPGKAATCTTNGLTDGMACSRCHETLKEQTVIEKLPHTEVEIPAVDVTCTTNGATAGVKCSVCGEILVAPEVIPNPGHEEEVIPAVAATCITTGLTEGKKCTVCGEILIAQEIVDAPGHTEEIIPAVAPTCTATGLEIGKKCSVCGEILVAQKTVAALGHKEEIIPAVAATCTTTGLTEGKKCTRCEEILVAQEIVDVLGHKEEIIPAVAATCTATGLTEGKKCTACGETLVAQTVVEKLPHTEEIIPAVAATCTATGLTEGKKCTACGEILVAQEVIDKLAHTPGETVIENEILPSCTKPGSHDEVVYCSECDEELSREQKTDAAPGHTAGTPVEENRVEATCAKEGSYDLITRCTVCGTVVHSETRTIEKLPHTEESIPAVEATCTTAGATAGVKCSVCGEILTAPETVPALGHTEVEIPAVAATCTEAGATAGVKCDYCGEILTAPETIPATGHKMITVPEKKPTCTEDGYTASRVCENCDYVQRPATVRPATGHTEAAAVQENVVDPTCTEDGSYDSVIYCVTCGEELKSETVVVPATGHTEGATRKENMVAAGCETEGSYDNVTYCSVCGEPCKTETVVLPALGHTEVEIPAVPATCAKEGATAGTRCSVCQKVVKAPEPVEKLPHTQEVIPAVAPTCTTPGATEGSKCSVCGEILVAPEEVAIIDHDWGTGRVTTEPTCEEAGVRVFTCSMCHASKEEEEPTLEHILAIMPAQKPTYTTVGWAEYEYCTRTFLNNEGTYIPCGYSTRVDIPALGEPEIDNFADFIENLSLLETIADTYVKKVAPGKDPASLIIKYIRTGVERYNSGSWNIMAGYEDKDFAAYVAKYEAEYNLALADGEEMMKVSGLKNLALFKLPSGDTADVGHIFGLMDISYTNYVNANVSGWAGDTVDLLSAADQYGVTANTVEELVAEIESKYFGKDGQQLLDEYGALPEEGSFSATDVRGDLDGYYIVEQLVATEYENQTLTELFSGYMTPSLTDNQRAAYFLKNKLGGVTLRTDVREAVFNVYSADKGVATLEGTREFKNSGEKLMNMRKAVCYVFADYLCRLAGDWVDDMENEYLTIFDTKTSILAPGITQKIYNATTADNQTMVYYVATADVTRSDVSVYANYNNNDPSQGWQMQRVLEQALAAQAHYSDPTFEHYTENFNVVAAVNGGGYNMHNGEPGGLFVMEGYEWKPSDGNYFFGILKDGTALVGTHQDYLNLKAQGKVKEAIGAFGTPLIYNGEIAIGREDAYYTSRASRTAVGVTATGKVVIMVVDGRQIGLSCGASMEEIAQIMLDAGCCAAINLDGGGSSTYVAKPEGESELRVVSNPSDGAPRSVSTSIFFASTAPSSTAFDHAVITSNYNYLTIGSSVQLTASAVSATGNVVEMPEGVTWAVDNEALGTVDQNGKFTAAANGTVTVNLLLDGKVIGSRKLFVVIPDNVYFDKETTSGIYGEALTLPVCAVYEGKKVVINENDVTISLTPDNAGTVSGFTMVGDEASGVRQVTVVGTLAVTAEDETPITGSMSVSMFRKDEASFDFDGVSGGDRQFAFLREVSNATESGTATYRVVDPAQPMVTTYTFALDMSQIPIPEKLSELTYMLPGADMEGASAWNFLLQLAERVSVLTNVTPELVFDKNFVVDYSGITVSNEYFTLDKDAIVFDEATNTLKLRLNWVDQEQPIDANTANPLCIVTGIKLIPRADANWGSSETLRPVNTGTISYDIYLRTNALYSFASKPENQEKFNLYPFENTEVIINGGTEKGGHFSEVYTTFQDTYTLMKGEKVGWVMEDGGWAYYENGARYTGFRVVDGLYYNFGTDGINIGQTPHTGPMTIDGKEYYAIQGKMFYGWQVVDPYNVSYYNETTGVKEKLTKVEVPSTCIVDGYADYTSESGATRHVDYDDAGGHEYVEKNGVYTCTKCGWERIDMKDVTIQQGVKAVTYTGKPIQIVVNLVAPNGYRLTKFSDGVPRPDYKAEYADNVDVGTATIKFTANKYGIYVNLKEYRGNCAGSTTTTFEIRPDLPTDVKMVSDGKEATISWTAAKAPGVTYVIYQSVDKQNWTELTTTTDTSITLNLDEAEGGVFKIGTRKEVGGKVYESLYKTASIYPSVKITTGNKETGEPTLKWMSIPNVTEYQVFRATSEEGPYNLMLTTKGGTFTNSSAKIDQLYYYKVVATLNDGTTREGYATNMALPGTVSAAAAEVEYAACITWTEARGAADYVIYRSDAIDGEFVEIGTSETLDYTDATVVPGTYYYKVAARSAKGNMGLASAAVSVDITNARLTLVVTPGNRLADGKPTLKWEKLEGAVSYTVYRATSQDGELVKSFTTKGSSYTNISAQVGDTYYYQVVAEMADGTKVKSDIVANGAIPVEETLVVTPGNRPADGKPTLKWNKLQDAVSYTVYRATSRDGALVKSFTTKGNTYTNVSAQLGKTFYYQVVAEMADGTLVKSDIVENGAILVDTQLVLTPDHNDEGLPTLKWNKLAGATQYIVYRADSKDGAYTKRLTTKGNTYTNTNAQLGDVYYYQVKAIMGDGTEIMSNIVANERLVPGGKLIVTPGHNSEGQPTLSWNRLIGGQKYVVYRATQENGTYTKALETKGTTYTNISAEAGHTYYYKVEATLVDGTVVVSEIVTNSCLILDDKVIVTVGHNANGDPTLTWNEVSGAETYIVYRATTKDGEYSERLTTSGTTYTNIKTTAGKTYYYKVKAILVDGTEKVSEVVENVSQVKAN